MAATETARLAGRLSLLQGDIAALEVDAIVNAANRALAGGGGVDGAIHRAAGPELAAACRAIGGCPTGEAVLIPGFALKARHIVHTVGPVWRGGGEGEDDLLAACYRNSLALAAGRGFATLAFPSISTGAYGFPIRRACRIAIGEAIRHCRAAALPRRVIFCCFAAADGARYREALAERGIAL